MKAYTLVTIFVSLLFLILFMGCGYSSQEWKVQYRQADSLALLAVVKVNPEILSRVDTTKPLEEWQILSENGSNDSLVLKFDSYGLIEWLEIHRVLDTLPPEIANFTSLTYLDVTDNYVKTIPVALSELTGLKTLYLGSNDIVTIPKEIGNMSSLQSLSLYWNRDLINFPKAMCKLPSLRYLRLGGTAITALPEEFCDLPSLEEFDMSQSQLTHLPQNIGKMKLLKSLEFGGHYFDTIPDAIWQLTNLERLTIYRANEPLLSPEIKNLQKLRSLVIREMPIPVLPKEIGSLEDVTYLFVLNCDSLKTLPPEIGNMENLVALSLTACGLTSLPIEITNITATERLHGIGYNSLNDENLLPAVVTWLDSFDPDWRETQRL